MTSGYTAAAAAARRITASTRAPRRSADRVVVRPDGRVEYRFRRPDPTGRTVIAVHGNGRNESETFGYRLKIGDDPGDPDGGPGGDDAGDGGGCCSTGRGGVSGSLAAVTRGAGRDPAPPL